MSGKGSTPRPIPDRERYEANWAAIDWGARDGVQDVHERSQAHGDTHGPGEVQPDDRQGATTGPRG